MEVREFGPQDARTIVLIPGNMMCWRQFEQVIPLLMGDFHVVALSTDGYDGTTETTFTTATASAEKLEDYIRDNLGGEIDLVFGESFGSATAGMLFHRQRVKVRSLIMSGPQCMDLGPLTPLMRAIIPRNQHRLLYSERDLAGMRATERLRAADRNPYSWNMELLPYEDGSGYEARFSHCGICTLMRELGLFDLVPAMCRLDYAMSDAGGRTTFVRENTLAEGGPYCDCGYKKR